MREVLEARGVAVVLKREEGYAVAPNGTGEALTPAGPSPEQRGPAGTQKEIR